MESPRQQGRSGNPLALPVSGAARIVNREPVPADEQQLKAFGRQYLEPIKH
ncbi:hypothetical protein [Streptomyces gobitricini]|uniref:Uncharacterized protein n=1 Tax=Streptomyces gobitricini TaxID=68211 RepID=A0ABP6AHZ7_9ACTN